MSEASNRPPNFKVESIYAVVANDGQGEGIVRFTTPAGVLLLVDANPQLFHDLFAGKGAQLIGSLAGPFRVLRFDNPH